MTRGSITSNFVFVFLDSGSNSYITFTSNQVYLLVGFPIQLYHVPYANKDCLVAFYIKFPPEVASDTSESIDGAILVKIINGSLSNIGNDIGKTLLSVSRYQDQSEGDIEDPVSPRIAPKEINPLVFVGISVGGALILIVLLVVVIRLVYIYIKSIYAMSKTISDPGSVAGYKRSRRDNRENLQNYLFKPFYG